MGSDESMSAVTMPQDRDDFFVGGAWQQAHGPESAVISPMTEEPFATVRLASRADVDLAVSAARDAMRGEWSRTPVARRLELLRRLRALLDENQEELANIITHEMGCPITQARAIQAKNPLRVLDMLFDVAERYPFQELRRSATGTALVMRQPVGVVAAVVPWNMPLSISIQKLAPALLAGCAVILKSSPETPLDAFRLAELVAEAGFPAGSVSVLVADRDVSEYLVTRPEVDKVSFTGSSLAGRRIASLCGDSVRRVTLELGGKSAALVLDDADLDRAVEALRLGSFRNSGQICTLKTRILVPERLEHAFVDRFCAMVASMPVGDPRDPVTQIGPMVSARQRERVEGYIAAGRAEGANPVLGGGRPQIDRGWYVEPTVFTRVDPGSTIAQEEIFGPVASIMTYRTEDEAIAIANDSPYGLSGAVFTADLAHGVAVAKRIRTGTVEINGSPSGFASPSGGFKISGIGRENGVEGLDAFVEMQSVGLPPEHAEALL